VFRLTGNKAFRFHPFFFSSRRRHTRSKRDWSSDVCSSDLAPESLAANDPMRPVVTKLAADYKEKFKADATTFIGHPSDAMLLIEIGRASCREREWISEVVGIAK